MSAWVVLLTGLSAWVVLLPGLSAQVILTGVSAWAVRLTGVSTRVLLTGVSAWVILTGVQWPLAVILICISLVTNCKQLFMLVSLLCLTEATPIFCI